MDDVSLLIVERGKQLGLFSFWRVLAHPGKMEGRRGRRGSLWDIRCLPPAGIPQIPRSPPAIETLLSA